MTATSVSRCTGSGEWEVVRDRIPELIRAEGRSCQTVTLDDAAFQQALLDKLLEEAQEVTQAQTPDERLAECADVLEVLCALLALDGLTLDDARTVQTSKRAERGGFEGRFGR